MEIPAAGNPGILNHSPLSNELFFQAQAERRTSPDGFEELYIGSRKIENRLYTDDQVRKLPQVAPSHVHAGEWAIRKRSSERLIRYLERKNKPLEILEVGCGNGWLSHRISAIKKSVVMGMDINRVEINQASRVFNERTNLSFWEGGLQSLLHQKKYDVIVFAASIQYFNPFESVMENALSMLKIDGEVHIMDSFFYKPQEIEKASHRSRLYYQSIGYGEMARFYFHHSQASLKRFKYRYLFNPAALAVRLFGNRHPFAWIRIRKS
jgi:ubiquinone/menaquinone biosynthesis C-methylase UbiE